MEPTRNGSTDEEASERFPTSIEPSLESPLNATLPILALDPKMAPAPSTANLTPPSFSYLSAYAHEAPRLF